VIVAVPVVVVVSLLFIPRGITLFQLGLNLIQDVIKSVEPLGLGSAIELVILYITVLK
jgi:hypothetical protein